MHRVGIAVYPRILHCGVKFADRIEMDTDNSMRSQAIISELKETHKVTHPNRDFMAFKSAQSGITFNSQFLESCELSLRTGKSRIDSLADGRAIMKTRQCSYSKRHPTRIDSSTLISDVVQSSSDLSKETV